MGGYSAHGDPGVRYSGVDAKAKGEVIVITDRVSLSLLTPMRTIPRVRTTHAEYYVCTYVFRTGQVCSQKLIPVFHTYVPLDRIQRHLASGAFFFFFFFFMFITSDVLYCICCPYLTLRVRYLWRGKK